MDIDLAARTSNQLDHIPSYWVLCEVAAEPDGVEFNRGSIEASLDFHAKEFDNARVAAA
jgi:hypothetical protein